MTEGIPGYEFVKVINPATLQALPIHPTAVVLRGTGMTKKDLAIAVKKFNFIPL